MRGDRIARGTSSRRPERQITSSAEDLLGGQAGTPEPQRGHTLRIRRDPSVLASPLPIQRQGPSEEDRSRKASGKNIKRMIAFHKLKTSTDPAPMTGNQQPPASLLPNLINVFFMYFSFLYALNSGRLSIFLMFTYF